MNSRSTLMATSALLISLLLTGCHTAPIRTAPLELKLTHADAFLLPDDCHAAGSVGIDFTVDGQGHTSNIKPANAPTCVQQALNAWVGAFQYEPTGTTRVTRMEWLLVEARRGS